MNPTIQNIMETVKLEKAAFALTVMMKMMSFNIEEIKNTIICGNSPEVMKQWPDKCIDFVCTDPPWPDIDMFEGVEPYELFNEASKEICRITTRLFVILSVISDPKFLSPVTLPFIRYCWLKYARPNYFGNILNSSEVGFVYGTLPKRRKDRQIFGGECIKTNKENPKQYNHSCARFLQHLLWIINHYSNPGELILDPFCGSGTTCVAAKRLGRDYIGIDINPEYCETARRRLEAEEKGLTFKELKKGQNSLFNCKF